ncbi:hypothetical protein Aperf_G00000059999 [Anoplocephala perfoliata]
MSSYVLVIGFHHKKGTSVEYVYPELETGLDLPPAWVYIPPTALPDGAHNYDKDYIFFTVPSLEQKPTTLFGIACYRQVDAKKFSNRTPDLTRNTVQKSVVFLSPAPLFGVISHLLDLVADAFISASSNKEGYEIVCRGFEDIQAAVNKLARSPLYERMRGQKADFLVQMVQMHMIVLDEGHIKERERRDIYALLQDLNAVSFVRAYQREALVLLKLLLLERKVLFACETAVQCMSTWLLTLVSLIPGMLNGGLSTCALIDETWVGERACWPLATLSRAAVDSQPGNPDASFFSASNNNERPSEFVGEESSASPVDLAQSDSSNSTRAGALRMVWSNAAKIASSVSNSRGDLAADQPQGSNSAPHRTTAAPQGPSDSSTNPAPNDVYSALPPLVDGSVFDSPLPTDDWGLPLSLFFRSYLFLPYVPLHALDMLLEFPRPPEGDIAPDPLAFGGYRVRGFLCGTTNPLLCQNTRLAEVIVNTLPFPSEISGREASLDGNLEIAGDSEMQFDLNQKGPSLNKSGGVFSRLLNRQQSTIRICPSPTEPGSSLRGLPLPLSRALQLTRLDRIFIDHVVNTVELWYSAKAAKDADSNTSAAGSEEITPKQIAEAEVLSRLPELTDLEKWIRAQFAVYVKSLLLTSDGRGGSLDDFNLNYVACLRSTHNFLAWRSQLVVPSVMKQMAEQQKQQQEEERKKAREGVGSTSSSQVGGSETQAPEAENPSEESPRVEHGDSAKVLGSTSASPARDIYAIGCPLVHPGRNLPSFEPAEQIVKNLKHPLAIRTFSKRFSAKLMRLLIIPPQPVNSTITITITLFHLVMPHFTPSRAEKGDSGGTSIFANSMRRLAGNVRSALDSVQSPPATSEEPKKATKSQGQQQK